MGASATVHTGPRTARFCILTLFHQDAIAFHFRVYVVGATAIVLLLYIVGVIPYATFLWGLTIGGLAVGALVWCLIRARKAALLNIRDPELRELAHDAMWLYISRKRLSPPEKRAMMKRLDGVCRSKRC